MRSSRKSLTRFDIEKIRKAGHETTVILMLTEDRQEEPTRFVNDGRVRAGKTVIEQ